MPSACPPGQTDGIKQDMLKKLSFQIKLYLMVLLIIICVMLISGGAFYHYSSGLMQENFTANAEQSLDVVRARVEDQYGTMSDIVRRLHASSVMMEIVTSVRPEQGKYFIKNTKARQKLNSLFLESIIGEDVSTSLHYVSSGGEYSSTFMNLYPYSEHKFTLQEAEKCSAALMETAGKEYQYVSGPHMDIWTDTDHSVFSVIRPIRDNYQTYGVIEIDQDVSVLDRLSTLEGMDDYRIFIVDRGKTVYENRERDLQKAEAEYSARGKTDFGTLISDGSSRNLWISSDSDELGMTFVMRLSAHTLDQRLMNMRIIIIVSYVLALVLIVFFLYAFTSSLVKPLRELKEKLLRISSEEQIDGEESAATENEVTSLTISIENLVREIRRKDYFLEEAKRNSIKAHLDMLESQINPHFLYNTLAVIGATGAEDGSMKVYNMCGTLAELLRYSIRYENRLVEFRNEIKNIQQYISIMKWRYENGLNVRWELDPSLDDVMIPKLILQPLVENCFKHGFEGVKPVWNLQISTRRIDGRWLFEVRDSGNVFSEEVITELQDNVTRFASSGMRSDNEHEQKRLGLESTLERLYMLYGDAMYWDIRNEEDYVTVTVGGPIHG